MGSSKRSVKADRLNMRAWIFFTLFVLCLAKQERNEKMFSLFSVVQFKNDPCTSNDKISSASTNYRNGTCVTSSECIERSGSSKGNCAAGFGVCCVMKIDDDSDTDVSYNDTYLQNPDYPSSYGDESSITYKVSKLQSDICFLRLDFEMFDVVALSTTALCASGDHLSITNTGSELDYPAICGSLAGSHMYVSLGGDASDSADIKVNLVGEANGETRKWEIKVSQIPCFSDYSPPEGCAQWFTEPSGTIQDWAGADNMLQDSLDYNVCVRQNMGYCCVEYQACDGLGDTTSSFRVATLAAGLTTMAMSGTNCASDWIAIDGAGGNCGGIAGVNKFCNDYLHPQNEATNSIPICDCTSPFTVGVHTDTPAAPALIANTGFCLNYRQVKC